MAAQASPCGPDPPRIPAEPLDLLRRLNATPNVHPEPRPASPRSPVPPPARISPSAVSSHPTPSRRSPSQPDRPRASPRSAPDRHDALSQPDRPPNGATRPRPRWDPSSSPSTWTPGPSAPDRGGGRPGLLYPPTKGYDGPHPRSRWGPPPSGAADAVHNRLRACGQAAVDNGLWITWGGVTHLFEQFSTGSSTPVETGEAQRCHSSTPVDTGVENCG